MKRIYLDHAATTPLDSEVFSSMVPYFKEYGNASSLHLRGRRAKQAVEDAREGVAKCIGAKSDEIIFTSSGTESDNLAILGVAHANKSHGKHIIISAIEHKAVLESAKKLEQEGFEISVAQVNEHGVIDTDVVTKMVRNDTILVSIMLGNNEIGTIQPINKLVEKIKSIHTDSQFPYIHTDACQIPEYHKIDIADLGVDLLTLNGSKIYGPKGSGLLYKRNSVEIEPIIVGGNQERGTRAGTESVPLIVGLANALEYASKNAETESSRLHKLRKFFIEQINTEIPDCVLNSQSDDTLPHIVHVSIPKIEGESVVLMLDEMGIEAATGSACSSKDLTPSHVLKAIGQDVELIHGSVRFSMGRETTESDIETTVEKLSDIVEKLQSMSALTLKNYGKEK